MSDPFVEEEGEPEVVRIVTTDDIPSAMAMSPEERRTYIGGSDAAKALDESNWGDSFSLVEEKLGLTPPPDLSDREDVYFGTVLEAVACSEYTRRTSRTLRRVTRLFRHPKFPWMGAHPDRIILGTRGIVEAKTARVQGEEWGEPGTDEVPRAYFIQGQHNMEVLDRDFCEYPVLFGGNRLLIYRVERDKQFGKDLVMVEYDRVWKWVEKGELPPPLTSDEANRRFRVYRPGEVQASQEVIAAWQRLHLVKRAVKRLAEIQDQLESALKGAMADHGDTLVAGTKKLATWKEAKGYHVDGFDVKPTRKLFLAKQ